jgi:hypothetical protein
LRKVTFPEKGRGGGGDGSNGTGNEAIEMKGERRAINRKDEKWKWQAKGRKMRRG